MAPLGWEPLVSAVVIFLNERRFLQDAIDSVLAQTYSRWELLLIDDGSSDGSTDIARSAAAAHPGRVRYLAHDGHTNLGMSASRNLGWTSARGELLTFLDGDDVFLPRKLERQVELLRDHGVDLVYGDTEFWYSWTGDAEDALRDQPRGVGESVDIVVVPPGLALRCFPLGDAPSPATCSLLVRREVVERVGGYEAGFRGMFEDQAFLAKLYLEATAYISPERHARYRMRADSCVSRSTRAGKNDEATRLFLRWLEGLLDREGIRDPAIRRALGRARRRYGFPRAAAALHQVRQLADRAGLASWAWANRISRAVRRVPTGTISASPSVALSSDRFGAGATTLSWRATGVSATEVRVNAPDGPVMTRSGASGELRTGRRVFDGTRFYLQDATGDRTGTPAKTLDVVRVRVIPVGTPGALAPDEMPPESVPARPAVPSVPVTPPSRAVILLYHRIAHVEADPWTLAVTPERFDEQLAAIRGSGQVVSLDELRRRVEDGSLPDRSIAVTFDDGYADNLVAARPLLERYQVPATVFVATGILSNDRDFWWDDLDRLFLQTERLPASLRLTIASEAREWDLGDDAVYDAAARRRHRHWRAWGEPDPTARQRLFKEIYGRLYPLGEQERRPVVDELLAWGGLSPAADRCTLTRDGLLELSRGELIEIGAHSVTHRLLVAAPVEDQRREIQGSKQDLEGVLGRPVTSFAYPFGKRGDYGEETVELVKASGFRLACSNFPGAVSRVADVHQLPRMFMGDWTGPELAAQLSAWFDAGARDG